MIAQNQKTLTGANLQRRASKKSKTQSVEHVRSEVDNGDDMQRRLRYQAQYAALQSLAFFDSECRIDYLYCEHQQDVLVKMQNGRFHGVQVKTKAAHLGTFKATEESIMASIARFSEQNKEFPSQFERFIIATNRAFIRSKDKHDVKHLISKSKQKTPHADLKKFFTQHFKNQFDGCCTQKDLQLLLRTVCIEDNVPDFGVVQKIIEENIAERGFLGCSYREIQDAALSLTNKMLDAASLKEKYYPGLIFLAAPEKMLEKRLLEEKKITKAMVVNLIKGALPYSGLPGSIEKPNLANYIPRKRSKRELRKIVAELANVTAGLVQWQDNLIGGTWIEQETYNIIRSRISADPHCTIFLLGGAGTGKSQLLSKLAANCISEGKAVLGIKADQLSVNVASLAMLGDSYGLNFDLAEVISSVSCSQPIVLIIDQLDAVSDLSDLHSERLNVLLELVNNVAGKDNIHIVMSARAYEAAHDSRLKNLKVEKIPTTLPHWSLVKPILESTGINTANFTDDQKEYFRNPQYLKVYLSVEKHKNG